MKTVSILRHAQAAYDAPSDIQRPLTAHGKEQARALGRWMKNDSFRPDIIYCSPARRTRETLEGITRDYPEILNAAKTQTPDHLYNAPAAYIMDILKHTQDEHTHILVIAHNPGIHQLSLILGGHVASSALAHALSGPYVPGTLTRFSFDSLEQWRDLSADKSTATHYIAPDGLGL